MSVHTVAILSPGDSDAACLLCSKSGEAYQRISFIASKRHISIFIALENLSLTGINDYNHNSIIKK